MFRYYSVINNYKIISDKNSSNEYPNYDIINFNYTFQLR